MDGVPRRGRGTLYRLAGIQRPKVASNRTRTSTSGQPRNFIFEPLIIRFFFPAFVYRWPAAMPSRTSSVARSIPPQTA